MRTATEEYLSQLAEDTDFEGRDSSEVSEARRHAWGKVKQLFLSMLNKLGLKGMGGKSVQMGDNELRYILWRSYKNLESPGEYRDVFKTAEDVAMRDRLGIDVEREGAEAEGERAAESVVREDASESEAEESEVMFSISPEGKNLIENARQLSEHEALDIFKKMAENAEAERILERTPENWVQEFGEDGYVSTPLGTIKLSEHQFNKSGREDRSIRFGLIKPTLERPDVILEKYAPKEGAERGTKYLYIKSYIKANGERVINFASITVKQGDEEVSISNHEIEPSRVRRELFEDKMLWNRFSIDSNSLGENQGLAMTQSERNPNSTDSGLNPHSIGKDNANNSSVQENSGKSGKISFSISPAEDAEYMDAVEKGDSKRAAEMVKEAARRAMPDTKVVDENGEPMRMYHGSDQIRTLFEMREGAMGKGAYFTSVFEEAADYVREVLGREDMTDDEIDNGQYVTEVYLNIKDMNQIATSKYGDGIIAVAKSPNQIKSADPVTYDDAGRVIPLSERFNPEKDDIRFSIGGGDEVFVSNAMRAVEGLDVSNVSRTKGDYRDVVLQPGDVVYADIPYERTSQEGYQGKFDKKAFAEWAQKQDVPVYVSEFTMPEGWTEVASFDVTNKGKRQQEKLWVQDKFAESVVREDASESEAEESRVMFSVDKNERKRKQFDIIQKANPHDDELGNHTWIRSAEDVKTYDEAIAEDGVTDYTPDYTADMVEKAMKSGKIVVYSSKPIEDGMFVTPSRMEAENYAGEGSVFSKEVSVDDVAWIDPIQGQYAKVDDAFAEKAARHGFDRTPPTKEESVGIIRSLINWAKNKIGSKRSVISAVTDRQLMEYKDKGINNIDKDYVHSMDSSDLIHSDKRHKGDNRTQIPLTEDEMSNVVDIIENFDKIDKGGLTKDTRLQTIRYSKKSPDGSVTYYVEEIRTGRKTLAFKTAYKKINGTDSSDGLIRNVSPSTPKAQSDNLNSVGKDNANNSSAQDNSEKSGKISFSISPAEDAERKRTEEELRRKQQEASERNRRMEEAKAIDARRRREEAYRRKVEQLKKKYGDHFDSDTDSPRTVKELIALNLPSGISWDIIQKEMGRNFSRGRRGDIAMLSPYISKDGRLSFDEAVHAVWESEENMLPDETMRWDTDDIRNAMIEFLQEVRSVQDVREYILRNREADAQASLEAEERAIEEARDDWFMEHYDLTYEEYSDFIRQLGEEYAQAEGYYDSEEFFNEIENERKRQEGTGPVEGAGAAEGVGPSSDAEGVEGGADGGGTAGGASAERMADDARNSTEKGSLTEDEADDLILASAERAIPMPEFELTSENWKKEFGDGTLKTPIEHIKIGKNQFSKMIDKGREKEAGLIKPTFTDPDFVIEEASEAADGATERASSHLYVKSFIGKDGRKRYFFKSVTVKRDGLEVNISSHFDRPKRLREALKNGKLLYRFDGGAQTEQTPASVSVTTSRTNPGVSAGKGSENSSSVQGKGGKNAENQARTPIQGLEGYSEADVLSAIRGDIEEKLADAGIDGVTIKDMALHGSRLRGDAREDSDLDVVVEYEGDMSEDGLFNILNDEPMEIEGVRVDVNPITRGKSGTLDQYMERSRQYDALRKAERETDTEPTEAQKEAGNYKKGHVKIDGYDVTIENPKGSVRRGTDASGKQWEQEMQNTYGYIRGTEGVDGDHIDVFFSEDPSQGDVFVVDQVNKDGSFDEHKVMYGFPDIESARKAYLSNYEDGWQGLGAITPVSKEEFKKWINSSHRKTKPFAEYSSVKPLGDTGLGEQPNKPTVKAGEDYVSAAERIAKEHEVKRTAAHFAEETQEEAAAFDKRVPKMDDAELLAYMQEDGRGDLNKAHHPSVYDEYDYRHGDEQLQSYDDTLVRLNESGTTLEQAVEMLANIQKDVSRLATEDRAMLLGQEDALQEYIAGKENEVPGHDLQEHIDGLASLQDNGKGYDENAYDAYAAGRRFGNGVNGRLSKREAFALAHKMVDENHARGGVYVLPFLDGVGDSMDLRLGRNKDEVSKREKEYRGKRVKASEQLKPQFSIGERYREGEEREEKREVPRGEWSAMARERDSISRRIDEIAEEQDALWESGESEESPEYQKLDRELDRLLARRNELARELKATRPAPTAAERRELEKRGRERFGKAKELAGDWAKKLQIDGICDVYDSIDEVPGSEGWNKRRRSVKGWYDPQTGRISIVMGNHRSPEDVVKTVLHEAVGHHGLRELFGEHFDNFLDNVRNNVDLSIGREIERLAAEHESRGRERGEVNSREDYLRTATEEYLARLAEDTDFEGRDSSEVSEARRHAWGKVKQLFLSMLNKLGLKGMGGKSVQMGDNELRYILWRSYKNLESPGEYRDVFKTAEDVAMRDRLGIDVEREGAEAEGERAAESVVREDASESEAEESRVMFSVDKNERKRKQFDIIQKANPHNDELGNHTWIRSADDIKTYDEALKEDGVIDYTPDYTADMVEDAVKSGSVVVYGSKPIKDGIFVTPSRMEAQNYAGDGNVYSRKVYLDDVAWIDPLQGQYAKVEKNGANRGGTAKSQLIPTIKSIGKSIFGNVYNQFKGKAKEAFDFIRKHNNSDLLGVFHREGFGDIDLIWGDDNGGAGHLISKHVGKGLSFATVEEAAKEIDDIIRNGNVDFENGDKAVFKIGSKQVTVRKNWRVKGKKIADKNWVLTAYDEMSADGGSPAAIIQGQAGKATDKSVGKGNTKKINTKENGEKNNNVSYSISPKEDAEYMDAVEKGDSKRAAEMVKEAARRAMPDTKVVDENGEPMRMFHGSDQIRTLFEMREGAMGKGAYFTSVFEEAADYVRDVLGREDMTDDEIDNGQYVTEVYLNIKDMNQIAASKYGDGIIAVATSPNQIKSADPVTYDDAGRVIPLSERFNPEKDDIRFSVGEEERDTEAYKADSQRIFDAAKKKFGTTTDMREAGYILPDGTMLDFSGRHELFGADDSGLRGRRATDHRVISTVAYEYDADGNEVDTGIKTDMPDFIERGAIRIDYNAGSINLSQKPTAEQAKVLSSFVKRKDGYVTVEIGNGWDTQHYGEYDYGTRHTKVLGDIDNYFDNGIMFSVGEDDIFVSNAMRAVEGIKQEKASPSQWLAMIQKAGGLKAGEDKWMGLSDWLKGQDKKSLTKDEVLEFIRENQVQIEEVEYDDTNNLPEFNDLQKEYAQWLRDEGYDYAWEQLRERYGDDADFIFDDLGGELVLNADDAAFLLGGDKAINSTRLDYTTKGLDNNKEIALTVPTIEPWNENDQVHFGDAGEGRAVAWIRFGETRNADGNRVLVIDEIQSKRHQEGRDKGYKQNLIIKGNVGNYEKVTDKLAYADVTKDDGIMIGQIMRQNGKFIALDSRRQRIDFNRYDTESEALAKVEESAGIDPDSTHIPDAPFEKNWHELAMKRMLRYAAENGYDKVAWTKGAQQAERYSLAAVIDNIAYVELPNGEIDARAYFKDGDGGYEFLGRTWEEVEKNIGKDMTRRMQQGEANRIDNKEWGRDKDDEPIFYDYKVIDGNGLRIGGEGMKGFYDQILPRFMDKYGKKWGVKTGEVTLPEVEEAGRTMWAVDVTPEMKESVMGGQVMFSVGENNPSNISEFEKKAVSLSGLDRESIEAQRSSMPKTAEWREGVDDVVVHTTLANVKGKYGELQQKAKAGDVEAAEELVSRIVNLDKVKAIVDQHPQAKVAFVHALESAGRNQIPGQYAGCFEDFGLSISDIVQTNRPHHTGADRNGRYFRRARFDGEVEQGAEYILVDDHITMGGTLRDLKDYIESKGGKVVAVSTLTASAGGTKLRPTEEQIKQLIEKGITNEELGKLGIANNLYGITRGEARQAIVLANTRGNQRTSRGREESSGERSRIEKETKGERVVSSLENKDNTAVNESQGDVRMGADSDVPISFSVSDENGVGNPMFNVAADDNVAASEGYDEGRMTSDERMAYQMAELARMHQDDLDLKRRALRDIGKQLAELTESMLGRPRKTSLTAAEQRSVDAKVGKAAREQMRFDKQTVDRIVRLARTMMDSGLYKNFSPYEVRRRCKTSLRIQHVSWFSYL